MSAKGTRDPEEALASNFPETSAKKRMEVWCLLAHAVLAVFLGGLIYLASKPGGPRQVFVFLEGRFLLALVALFVLFLGGITCTLRRPFLQRGRLRSFVFLVVVIGLVNWQFPYPSPHAGHPSATFFRLPVKEEWTVFWGGEDSDSNRLASFLPDRRFGMDLVLAQDGELFSGSGDQLEDWYCFGKDVLAPAGGKVVRIRNDAPDVLPRNADRRGRPEGNLIVIETAEGEFCFLTHLKQGSVRGQVGLYVGIGQKIGEVGSSGFSAFSPIPHLALHLQDTPEPRGEAIPWRFYDYTSDGVRVNRGLPEGGVDKEGRPVGERVRQVVWPANPGLRPSKEPLVFPPIDNGRR